MTSLDKENEKISKKDLEEDAYLEKMVLSIGNALVEETIEETIEDKIQKIKNCFMSKGLIGAIDPNEMRRLNLDKPEFWDMYIMRLASKDFIKWNSGIEGLRIIYNNFKKKCEEVPEILARISDNRPFINGQGLMLTPEWRAFNYYQGEIYSKFISRRDFMHTGMSPDPLIDTILTGLVDGNTINQPNYQHIDFRKIVLGIKDLMECWILILELLVPGIKTYGGKRKKRSKKTRISTKRRYRNRRKNRRKTNKY